MRKYPGQPNESAGTSTRSYCSAFLTKCRRVCFRGFREDVKGSFRLHNLEATVRQAFVEQVAVLFIDREIGGQVEHLRYRQLHQGRRAVMADSPRNLSAHIYDLRRIRTRRIDRQIADSLARQRQRLGKRVAADRIGIKFRYIRLLFAVKYDFPIRFIRNQEISCPYCSAFLVRTSASFVNVSAE